MSTAQRSTLAIAIALFLGGAAQPGHAQSAQGGPPEGGQTPAAAASPQPAAPGDAPQAPAPGAAPQAPPPSGAAKPTGGERDAAQLEEIVVTGIRASHELSLIRKREADTVMDVVTAEDIGKLPDKNVADAVQRVPGVNIMSGSGGEGGFSENDRVSIHGTNPSLTQTTVNGHMISTGDWYIGDQTNTVGRSASYTLLPSEIVGAVEVQKSSQADYIEGGTAGNVNIVTRLPLDFKKTWTMEATVQDLYSDLPRRSAPQANALVNWKNDADNLGVLFQAFSESRHERRDGQELFLLGEGTIGAPGDNSYLVVQQHPNLAGVVYPSQIGSALFTQNSTREGGLFDVQMKPSTALALDLNGFYSHFNGTNFDTNFMASPTNLLGQGISPTSYTVVDGTLESAVFPNTVYNGKDPMPGADEPFPGIRDSIYRPNAGSTAGYLDLDAKFKASASLLLTTKVGFTRGLGVTPHDYGYEAYLINSPLVYTMNGTNGPANVSFPGVNTENFNDPAHVTNGGSWSDTVKVSDQEGYAQEDALWTFEHGTLESIKAGVRYAVHNRTEFGINYGCSVDPNNVCYANPGLYLPAPAWYGSVSPGNFGSGIGAGPGFLSHFWTMDPNSIVAWQTAYQSANLGQNYQGDFTIEEKDSAAYVMGNFAGTRWRGNLGLRLVNTSQYSQAWDLNAAQTAFVPTVVNHDYFNALPSANLKIDVSQDLVARLAASETMSRADYSALSPAVTLNNIDLTGTGGNANLKPIHSINYDATLEWYFARQSLLSLDLFVMNMPSYVTFGYNSRPFLNTSIDQISTFIVTSPFNVGADNRGFELSWQQPLFGGFGALANYSYADGHTTAGQPLVGNSHSTWNAEGYYENRVFSARVAYTYRSTFLVGLANVTEQYAAPLGTLAASLNYKITDELAITIDGLNLNNPIIKYYSNAAQPQAFYSNGRQYYLGFRLTL